MSAEIAMKQLSERDEERLIGIGLITAFVLLLSLLSASAYLLF